MGGDEMQAALAALVGRTVVAVDVIAFDNPESVELHTDDGAVWTFTGWGHDHWGIEVEVARVGGAVPGGVSDRRGSLQVVAGSATVRLSVEESA